MIHSEPFDLNAPENRTALACVRFVVRSALTWFAVLFVFGVYAGWSLSKWSDTRLGAVLGAFVPLLAGLWVAFTFTQTNGVMHRQPWHGRPGA